MKLDSRYSVPDLFRLAWSLLLTRLFFRSARLVRQPTRIRGYANMRIGSGFTTGQYCRIEAGDGNGSGPTLRIGKRVQINDRCHLAALCSVTIGDDVLVASNVFISDHDHGDTSAAQLGLPPARRDLVWAAVTIENNAWIGENAVILKGVTVGHSSIVAAGAVVTRDVPPFSVAAGVPARVVKRMDSR